MNPYVKGRWNRPQEVQTVNVIVIQVLQLILIPKVKLKTSLLVTNLRVAKSHAQTYLFDTSDKVVETGTYLFLLHY
jgi:hypothetical protein